MVFEIGLLRRTATPLKSWRSSCPEPPNTPDPVAVAPWSHRILNDKIAMNLARERCCSWSRYSDLTTHLTHSLAAQLVGCAVCFLSFARWAGNQPVQYQTPDPMALAPAPHRDRYGAIPSPTLPGVRFDPPTQVSASGMVCVPTRSGPVLVRQHDCALGRLLSDGTGAACAAAGSGALWLAVSSSL